MCEYDKMSSLFTVAKITPCQHEINHPKLFTWMMCYNAVPEPNTVLGIYWVFKKCLLIQRMTYKSESHMMSTPSTTYVHTKTNDLELYDKFL